MELNQETSDDCQVELKCYEYNNKDEDNSSNNLNNPFSHFITTASKVFLEFRE